MAIKNKTKVKEVVSVSNTDKQLVRLWLEHKADMKSKGIRVTFKPSRFRTSIEHECGTIYLDNLTVPPTKEEINQSGA